jgi:hypothetical protein
MIGRVRGIMGVPESYFGYHPLNRFSGRYGRGCVANEYIAQSAGYAAPAYYLFDRVRYIQHLLVAPGRNRNARRWHLETCSCMRRRFTDLPLPRRPPQPDSPRVEDPDSTIRNHRRRRQNKWLSPSLI